jgi:integrase
MATSAHPTGWADLLSGWELHLIAADRTPQTIETRTEHMRRIARAFPDGPHQLDTTQWEQWSGRQKWATETRRSYTASVRAFYRWAELPDPTASLPPIRPSDPNPRPIPEHLLHQALAIAPPRTVLILRLASEAGLRRAEIGRVHTDDLMPGPPALLHVHGKGRRHRVVPLPDGLARAIATAEPGWLFPGPKGHLIPRTIDALAAEVLPEPWTLHTLRHRFAALAYTGRDILAVQRLLGHRSPATTQRYIPSPVDDLLTAASHAHLST